jgi:hypothetical protein
MDTEIWKLVAKTNRQHAMRALANRARVQQ